MCIIGVVLENFSSKIIQTLPYIIICVSMCIIVAIPSQSSHYSYGRIYIIIYMCIIGVVLEKFVSKFGRIYSCITNAYTSVLRSYIRSYIRSYYGRINFSRKCLKILDLRLSVRHLSEPLFPSFPPYISPYLSYYPLFLFILFANANKMLFILSFFLYIYIIIIIISRD
jgi:hypothetical protein